MESTMQANYYLCYMEKVYREPIGWLYSATDVKLGFDSLYDATLCQEHMRFLGIHTELIYKTSEDEYGCIYEKALFGAGTLVNTLTEDEHFDIKDSLSNICTSERLRLKTSVA